MAAAASAPTAASSAACQACNAASRRRDQPSARSMPYCWRREVQASVNVQLVGEPAGAKEGGVLSQVQREINVEALPMEIPEHIDLDVSGMAIGDTLRLADLAPIEGVTYLDSPEETVLATVTLPTREVEPEPEELPEGELPEGEVPEGEEAPEGAAEQPAEGGEAGAGEQGEPGTTES